MGKKLSIGIVGLLVLGALVIAMTGTVLAQEEEGTPRPEKNPFGSRGRVCGFGGQVGLEAAAGALGIDADELSTRLWGGETLADIAEEQGVALEDVRDAVTEARKAAMRDAIDRAEENGDLSSGHADWLREGLDNDYLGGHGFGGFHGGFRGRGGFRGFHGRGGVNFGRGASDA